MVTRALPYLDTYMATKINYQQANGGISKIDWNGDPKGFRRDARLSFFYYRDCIKMNCAMIEPSSIQELLTWYHDERHWNGHWKRDSGCTYSQYTDNELQH